MRLLLQTSNRRLIHTGLTLVLIIATSVTAQGQQETNVNEKSRELSGVVVNDNGQPIAGTRLVINALGAQQPLITTSGADGFFKVSGLDQTIYTVSAYSPSYVPVTPNRYGPITYYTPGDSIKIKLTRGAVITGTVTNDAGEPVVSVTVRALMLKDTEGNVPYSPFGRGAERTTDDRGVYRMYGLPAGRYVVLAGGSYGDPYSLSAYDSQAPTYAPSSNRDTAAEFTIAPGEELANVDIKYRGEPGHVISGTANGADATAYFTIMLNSTSTGQAVRSTFQPQAGRGFMFTGVPDDTYDVWATSNSVDTVGMSDPIRVTVKGNDITGLQLLTKPLASVSGRLSLVKSNAPECIGKRPLLFSETLVMIQRPYPKTQKDRIADLFFSASSNMPDKDGNFTFRNLRPGQYSLMPRLFARYWYVQSIKLATPVQTAKVPSADAVRSGIDLKSGDRISGITINLAEGAGSLRGTIVTNNETRRSDLYLFLVPAEREAAEDPLRFFASLIQQDDKFSINNIPPGRYWTLIRTGAEKEIGLLRLPGESENRAKLLREAEAVKSTIELKPCQNITDFRPTVN